MKFANGLEVNEANVLHYLPTYAVDPIIDLRAGSETEQ